MPIALTVTLILVLLACAAVAIPLGLQLIRTARATERFLESAQADLSRIREDIHALRERIDAIAASLQPTLDQAARLSLALGQASSALEGLVTRYKETFDAASRNVGLALGGLGALLRYFRGEKADAPPL